MLLTQKYNIQKKSLRNDIIDNGSFKMVENLDASEIIDRNLVKWKNYAYENGNFYKHQTLMHQV